MFESHFLSAWRYYMLRSEPELETNDLKHHMICKILELQGKNLIFAPVPRDIGMILDLGTGTGIWAMDVADAYPDAQVLGMDLSPIQPTWVPPNCLPFEISDFELEWESHPGRQRQYDLIHSSETVLAISAWDELLERCFE
ncbi:hypothetical protein F4778DRAFT_352554 [Xylariomycetidae sp. FL2044]|nr:hypothetical protein F4778DRAFT_352554 [Xylariomycetidae sp. FL2044]